MADSHKDYRSQVKDLLNKLNIFIDRVYATPPKQWTNHEKDQNILKERKVLSYFTHSTQLQKILSTRDAEINQNIINLMLRILRNSPSSTMKLAVIKILLDIVESDFGCLLSAEQFAEVKTQLFGYSKELLVLPWKTVPVTVYRHKEDSGLGFSVDAMGNLSRIGKKGPGVQPIPGQKVIITPMMLGSRVDSVDGVTIHTGEEFRLQIRGKTKFKLQIQYDQKQGKFLDIIVSILKIIRTQLRHPEDRKKILACMSNKNDQLGKTIFALLTESSATYTNLRTQIHDMFNDVCHRYPRQSWKITRIILGNGYDANLNKYMENAPDIDLDLAHRTPFLNSVLKLYETIEKGKKELPDSFIREAAANHGVKDITLSQSTNILQETNYDFSQALKVPAVMEGRDVNADIVLQLLVEHGWDQEKVIETLKEPRFCLIGSPVPILAKIPSRRANMNWLRFDCLQSDPLILQENEHDVSLFDVVSTDSIVPAALDFSAEEKIISKSISQCSANFEWDISILTRESLFRLRSHILHLSGHGDPGTLIIEDGCGGTLLYGKETLEKMNLRESNPNLRIVFVSMCHSESVAQQIADMGVPHVIAVKNAEKVKDKTAIEFTDMFYTYLFKNGLTLGAAFKSAVSYIEEQGNFHVMTLKKCDLVVSGIQK